MRVGIENRHHVALLEAQLLEDRRDPSDESIELGVGQAILPEDEDFLIGHD
jgi:hypothetical protein